MIAITRTRARTSAAVHDASVRHGISFALALHKPKLAIQTCGRRPCLTPPSSGL